MTAPEPRFLSISEVIEIHEQEIKAAGGLAGIRDAKALESAIGAPQASFKGEFLMDYLRNGCDLPQFTSDGSSVSRRK